MFEDYSGKINICSSWYLMEKKSVYAGSIQCVLHPKVLLDNNIDEAGCMIILKEVYRLYWKFIPPCIWMMTNYVPLQVSVFCPQQRCCYLNIVPNNVLQVHAHALSRVCIHAHHSLPYNHNTYLTAICLDMHVTVILIFLHILCISPIKEVGRVLVILGYGIKYNRRSTHRTATQCYRQ